MLDRTLWAEAEKIIADMASATGRLVYVPNHGNAGDALLASGAWQLFDDMGISPTVVRTRQIGPGDAVIYGGGGNLIPDYYDCSDCLERCLEVNARSVLVLSHSIRGHEQLLGRLDSRFTLVAREQESLDWINAQAPGAGKLFAPDMALRLDVDRLFRNCDALTREGPFRYPGIPLMKTPKYFLWRRRIARVKPIPLHTSRPERSPSREDRGESGRARSWTTVGPNRNWTGLPWATRG